MKKVVMLLSNGFNPDVRVHKEAKTLVDNGYEVEIIAWDRLSERPKKETVDGIKVDRIQIGSAYGKIASNLLTFPLFWTIAFFELLSRDFDVVHCHDFDTLLVGFLAGKLKRRCVVYDAHENYSAQKASKLPGPMIWKIARLESFLSRHVDCVITVNEILGGLFKGFGARVVVVMNCQRLEEYQLSKKAVEEARRRINPKNEFLIVYIGGFIAGRGLEKMLQAMVLMKGEGQKMPRLVLFGRGPLEGKLRKLVDDNDLNDSVLFGGFIDPSEVPLYTEASDLIFALYMSDEMNNRFASPNKLFEAVAAGRPIIVTGVGILGEVVRKEKIGIVIGCRPEEIVTGIKLLADKGKIYRELSENSKKTSNRYNWAEEEKKLLRVYRNDGYETDSLCESVHGI